MKTFWLIERMLHEDEFYARLSAALKARDIEFKEVDFIPTDGQKNISRILKANPEHLFVPYGCIEYLKWFTRSVGTADVPMVESASFFNLKRLAFDYYSSYWGSFMLNQRNVITTFAELIRKVDFFYEILGEDDTIFVRPVSNDKVFTGKAVYREEFAKFVKYMGHNVEMTYDPHMPVVVAAPQNVVKEWRFAVINKKVVASTLYNVNGLHEEKEGCENETAAAMAQYIAADEWQPDDVYVMDICQTKTGEVAMLEIGSLNSAGLYAMNLQPIVDGIEAWKEKYVAEHKVDPNETSLK